VQTELFKIESLLLRARLRLEMISKDLLSKDL
jgi:hypothetical protein